MKSFSSKMPATLLDEEKTPVKNITGVFSFLPFKKYYYYFFSGSFFVTLNVNKYSTVLSPIAIGNKTLNFLPTNELLLSYFLWGNSPVEIPEKFAL